MRHGSLFSGIGGFDLAAQWMNWTNVFHTEWNEFGQKILQHHFPNSISYHDIIKTDYTIHNGDIDIITGGFPCQPFSLAGKRKGTDDERYLWHEMLRAIQQIQPTYVVAENVRGLLSIDGGMVFQQVCLDLEAEGYEVQPILLPAAGVNAPHRRDRIFIVAYSKHNRHQAIRRKEEEENGISGVDRSEMGARQSDRTDIRPTAANTNGTDKGSSNRRTDCKTEGNLWRNEKSNVSGTRDCTEPAANTNLRRLERSEAEGWNSKHVEWTGSIGSAANTKDKRTGKLRNESSKEGTRFCDVVSGKPCGLSESTEPAANTKGKRYAASTDRWQGISAQEEQALHGRSCDGTTHGTWQNFPTESAICGRDDGLSNRLDNITFPKWRNESIKAYGNAVVPQLILPIFQTIEKLHREKK
jgi:DNA (cytosine-5)-methyltransferase 1